MEKRDIASFYKFKPDFIHEIFCFQSFQDGNSDKFHRKPCLKITLVAIMAILTIPYGNRLLASSETIVANIKSAIKRIDIAERNRLRNKSYKSAVRTLMKKCLLAAEACGENPTSEQMTEIQQHLSAAYSKIDKAVKRGVIHPNNGARKKARLAKAIKRLDPVPAA